MIVVERDGERVVLAEPRSPSIIPVPPKTGTTPVPGRPGPPGPPGPAGGTFIYNQSDPSEVWDITHNLGYFPGGVFVRDTSGTPVDGSTEHVDENSVRIHFSAPFAGQAFLS